MPEVANNAALLVNPTNINEIRHGIEKITNNENYRNKLIENGLKNATYYSPTLIADKYMSLYQLITNR